MWAMRIRGAEPRPRAALAPDAAGPGRGRPWLLPLPAAPRNRAQAPKTGGKRPQSLKDR